MVFTANAAVVRGREAVLSRFRHPERQGEEPFWRRALEGLGITVHALPDDVPFEGAGDALFVGERLFCGHGFRTELGSHALVSRPARRRGDLAAPRGSALLSPRHLLLPAQRAHRALRPGRLRRGLAAAGRRLVPHVIEVPVEVAAGFACNAISLGDRVISSLAAERLEEPLHHAGFDTVALPMSEFLKSGGGVRCLSLPLELDPAA